MTSLFRYISDKYLQSTLDGKTLFRSLSYYRSLENDGIRGDRFEGSRVHRPKDGLVITIVETGESKTFPTQHFISSANDDYIYVS
jgi:hypothetical protein